MPESVTGSNGIPLLLLMVHLSNGYVKMQSMNSAGRYHNQLSLRCTVGKVFCMKSQ